MRVEQRIRLQRDHSTRVVDVVILSESQEESAVLDLLGTDVADSGLIARGRFELRLSDAGEHYVLLKGER